MGKMLKLEFRKLFKGKSFIFCTLATLLGSALMILLYFFMDKVNHETSPYTGLQFLMTGTCQSLIVMTLAIFVSIFVCSDYSDGTLKTVFSRGNSRVSVYIAKFITLAVATLIMFVLTLALNYGAVSLTWEKGSWPNADHVILLLAQYVSLLSCVSVYLFFSELFAKTGAALPVNLFVLDIVSLIALILDYVIDQDFIIFSKWMPEYCLNSVSIELIETSDVLNHAFICGGGYIVIFGILGLIAAQSKEV